MTSQAWSAEPWPVERLESGGRVWLTVEDYARARVCVDALVGVNPEVLGTVLSEARRIVRCAPKTDPRFRKANVRISWTNNADQVEGLRAALRKLEEGS